MNKLKSLSLVALTAFGLSAYGGTTTNDWWNVTLEDDSFQANFPGLEIGQLGALTNDESTMAAGTVQPYAAGVWSALDGDESYVTNGLATNWVSGAMNEVANTTYLKLDTQGNDLTWTPDTTDVSNNIMALVDADLYLVGSDSAPDASDFDAGKDVHTAVYLKNETDETSGETTNSVLCVYVFDGIDSRYWQELDGEPLDDNAWAHVQVVVDYTDASAPMVQVFVNGTQMHARDDASTVSWPAAVTAEGANVYKLSSVAFRGTGAVDNFVGTTQVVSYDQSYFKAEVYLDNDTLLDELCQVTANALDIGGLTPATFTQFMWEEYDDAAGCAVYGLDRVEITDFANNRTQTYTFDYDYVEGTIDPMPDEGAVSFYGEGYFRVTADTTGAPGPATEGEVVTNTIVKIFFKTAGAKDAYATTTMGNTTTTNAVTLKPVDLGGVYPTNLVWTFDAVQGDTILTNLVVSNGATFDGYANGQATVKVTVADALAADTLYAAASYVAGALADNEDLRPTTNGNEIVFAPYTPPVAMIGTTEYPSLRAAIEAATAGDTITLVRDDHVSFTSEALEIMIDKALTIDGGSHTLYGVTGGYADGSYHDIFVVGSGALTIKDLKFSEFGDTAATFQYETYPIVTSGSYTGALTLDGVTMDKFARTAVNLNGGTVLITNCTFTADSTAYYQTGVETLNATVTVVDSTITGVNSSAVSGEETVGAAVFTLKGHDGYTGTGSITVLSGTYSGQLIVAAEALATGSVDISNGVFIATAAAGESAFELDAGSIVISGGWFDREPEAGYLAAGYTVEQDIAGAPVDGAYQHVVPVAVRYNITFNDEDGTLIVVTSVLAGATAYAPADPAAAEGFTFAGWTNALDATDATVYTNASLPAAAGDATYAAKYEASAVTKPEVDVGQGLKDYVPAQGETVPAPIEFTDAATPLCELSFVAPEAGWYFLYTSTTVNGEYTPDYTTKVQANKDALVTLTESAAGTTKFFKIGWSETEPTAE